LLQNCRIGRSVAAYGTYSVCGRTS